MAMPQHRGLVYASRPRPALQRRPKLRFFSVSSSYSDHQDVAAVVLGGEGASSRLYPLTKRRCEGAVPMAGNYRLVDCVVSNCIHSGIDTIFALTQFNSTSLNSHLSRAYPRLQLIAAFQSPLHTNRWFQGDADAVRRCMWLFLEEHACGDFLLLPGHHLYKMDYRQLIEAHRDSNADITIAASSAPTIMHDPGFGFLQFDSLNRVTAFRFKSHGKWTNAASSLLTSSNMGCSSLPSMGIYAIKKEVMKKLVEEDFGEENDFASQVIPGAVSMGMKVQAFVFGGHWEDMRSVGAFYQSNIECAYKDKNENSDRLPELFTLPRRMPPTLITDQAVITDSLIGDGCTIGRCKIKGCVIGLRSRVGDGAVVEDSVIFGADAEQGEEVDGVPIGIGEHTNIRKAIVDKNARIGKHVMIINRDKVEEREGEAEGYVIRDGIVILLPNALIPDATIL